MCFFNKSAHSASKSYDLNKLCDDKYVAMRKREQYSATEQWSGIDCTTDGKLSVKLKKHESKVFIVK